MDQRIGNRIGGSTTFPQGPTFDSTAPARPAEVLATFPASGPEAVDEAVAAAADAQRSWARLPVPARADVLTAAADVIARGKDELARLVAREAGKVLVEAAGDVQEAVDMGRFVAGQGRAAMGAVVPSELPGKLAWTTREPVGVVGMITPWNFPVAIPSWKFFPALLAGNGIVIKPSEEAPLCAERVRRLPGRGRGPRRPPQRGARPGRAGGALAVHPGVGRRQLHRLGAHRAACGGGGDGGRAEARLARARRQERHGRARRRRPRPRRRRRAVRRLRHRRPALHLHVAPRRAARRRRRGGRPPRRAHAAARAGRPARSGHRRRARHHAAPAPASWPWSTMAVAEGGTVALGGDLVRGRGLRRRHLRRAHDRAGRAPTTASPARRCSAPCSRVWWSTTSTRPSTS